MTPKGCSADDLAYSMVPASEVERLGGTSGLPTVAMNDQAIQEGRIVGREEYDHAGDVGRCARATEVPVRPEPITIGSKCGVPPSFIPVSPHPWHNHYAGRQDDLCI
jgi:hypothetical protein